MGKNEIFEIKRFSDIYLSKTKTQNGFQWTKIDQRCGCSCNQNLINDEFGFVCHHVLDLHRQIDSTDSNEISEIIPNRTDNSEIIPSQENLEEKQKLIAAIYHFGSSRPNNLIELVRNRRKEITSINECYINGHGPIHCGSARCPFQPDFPINRTSIEEDIREKIEKLKHFCKIVFHSEVNYHLKPIKSLVKSIIKKIKLKLDRAVQNEQILQLSITRRLLSLAYGKRYQPSLNQDFIKL